jgi:hypothetical protein
LDERLISWDKVCTLGELVAGTPARTISSTTRTAPVWASRRRPPAQRSFGRARESGMGQEVPTGWFGSDLTQWYSHAFYASA